MRVSAHQGFSEVLVHKQIACGYVTNHLGSPVAHGNPGTRRERSSQISRRSPTTGRTRDHHRQAMAAESRAMTVEGRLGHLSTVTDTDARRNVINTARRRISETRDQARVGVRRGRCRTQVAYFDSALVPRLEIIEQVTGIEPSEVTHEKSFVDDTTSTHCRWLKSQSRPKTSTA